LRVDGESVFEITVEVARLGENSAKPKRALSFKASELRGRGARWETGMSVLFTHLQRVAPMAGLAIALFATVAWIGLVGYALIKLL
jgi:hypothetical protein